MDAHLFRLFANLLEPLLLGARLEKIQEPEPGIMAITFYGGGRKRQLWLKFSRKAPFCFLTDTRMGAGREPSAQIMRIRRYFADRRVVSVVCQVFARKIWLLAATPKEKAAGKAVWLCLDLASGPSLHFLEADSHPEPECPQWPRPDELAQALEDCREWPVLTPALRRALARMDEPDQWALLEDLRAGNGNVFLYSSQENGNERVRRASAWPLSREEAKDLREEESADVAKAIEAAGRDLVQGAIYEKRHENMLAPIKRRVKSIHKLLEKLQAEETRFRSMEARGPDAQAIADNLWRLEKDCRESAITLPGPDGEERKIALDRRFGLRENMERLFHAARRGRRGLAMLEERRATLQRELEGLRDAALPAEGAVKDAPGVDRDAENAPGSIKAGRAAAALRKSLPRNVALYVSSDGYMVLRGKDSKGNHAMRRYASPHDLWAHVETGPGAHVIIRRSAPGREIPERTLAEAGGLAAAKSWLAGAATAPVMFAEMRHVRPARNGPAGKMIIDKVQFTRDVPVDAALEKNIVAAEQGF